MPYHKTWNKSQCPVSGISDTVNKNVKVGGKVTGRKYCHDQITGSITYHSADHHLLLPNLFAITPAKTVCKQQESVVMSNMKEVLFSL